MILKRPMLACSTIPNIEDLSYPVIASPKLDGIRCLMIDGKAYSRNLKPIPNKFIQQQLEGLRGLDGELTVKGDFNDVQSAVMSVEGEPDFTYMVFDKWNYPGGFEDRLIDLEDECDLTAHNRVEVVEQLRISTAYVLHGWYSRWLGQGYEGAIVRDPDGPYKQGRSTAKQGWMLKLKDFKEDEATIINVLELMHNENEATIGELGQTTRSHEQAGKVPGNTMGSLLVSYTGRTFKIGTGFSAQQRATLWAQRDSLKGQEVTFKYQELSKDGIPRFPVFKSLRKDK